MPDIYYERWLLELLMLVYVIAVTGFVVLERRRPVSTMAWLLALVFVPGLGLAADLGVGRHPGGPRPQQREGIGRGLKGRHGHLAPAAGR